MSITSAEFLSFYPEFEGSPFTTELIDSWLVRVETIYCPESFWIEPTRRNTAVMLRTAHILETMRQQMAQSASIGAAISQGQSVSLPQTTADDLEQTVYGRQFKELRRLSPSTGFAF